MGTVEIVGGDTSGCGTAKPMAESAPIDRVLTNTYATNEPSGLLARELLHVHFYHTEHEFDRNNGWMYSATKSSLVCFFRVKVRTMLWLTVCRCGSSLSLHQLP